MIGFRSICFFIVVICAVIGLLNMYRVIDIAPLAFWAFVVVYGVLLTFSFALIFV